MHKLRLRRVDGALITDWPDEALAHMKAREGDELYAFETPFGVLVTSVDLPLREVTEAAEKVFRRNAEAYRELAKK